MVVEDVQCESYIQASFFIQKETFIRRCPVDHRGYVINIGTGNCDIVIIIFKRTGKTMHNIG